MAEPVHIIGIGAQKAGTTWLHHYLSAHPECGMSPIKEVHYFDTVAENRRGAARPATANLWYTNQQGDSGMNPAHLDAWTALLAQKDIDPEAYSAFLRNVCASKPVIGEITPAYATLPEEELREMCSVAPDVRVVYLMRDPVQRFWSFARMRAVEQGGGIDRATHVVERLMQGQMTAAFLRGDYATVLPRLTRAIPRARLHVAVFETLLAQGTDALCRFLGIAPRQPDTAARVNAGVEMAVPNGLAKRMAVWLAPQYDYVRRYLGDLPAPWRATLEEYA